jgi:transposase
VHAGFTAHWSSGPVERNINRLKLIKRQMFGRAKFDLLRKRVLLASRVSASNPPIAHHERSL